MNFSAGDKSPTLPGGIQVLFGRNAASVMRWAFVFLLLTVYVLFSRMWGLADKVMHHDESLFAYYGFWLYRGNGYDYQPILHGPILQYVSAFFFLLFGDDQWTMRLPSLVGGLLMFPLLWYWRRYIGFYGMVGAMVVVALSPSLTFYTRFLRNDVPYLTVTMWCALCLLRLFDSSSDPDSVSKRLFAWGSVLTAALMFSMMESSIFFFSACLGFLGTILIWDQILGFVKSRRFVTETTEDHNGLILVIALVGSVIITGILSWLYWRILAETIPISTPIIQVLKVLGITIGVKTGNAVLAFLLFLGLFVVLGLSGLAYFAQSGYTGILSCFSRTIWGNKWALLGAIALAVVLYTTAFTTFFTFTKTASFDHTARDFSGPEKYLTPVQIYKNTWDYWWDQHKLHRIKGPFHYYLPILLLYELPLLVLVVMGWWTRAFRVSGKTANRDDSRTIPLMTGRFSALVILFLMHGVLAIVLLALKGKINWQYFDVKFHVTHPAHLFLILLYVQLLVYVFPRMFFRGYRVESFVSYWGVTALFAYSYAGEKVPWLTVHVVGPFAILAGIQVGNIVAGFVRYSQFKRVVVWTLLSAAVLYQLRNQHLLQFVHPWSSSERLVYNHTSPDFQSALAQIEKVEKATNYGKQIPIYMEGEMGWPLHWYLRAYNNLTPDTNENADNTSRPIVMVDWVNAGNENLKANYDIQRMKVREWWEPPMLDLAAMSDVWRIFTPQESRADGLNATQYAKAKSEWRKLWRYLAYREIWLDPNNYSFSNGANEFAFAIRKDLLKQSATYDWLSQMPKLQDIPVFTESY